MKRVGVAVAIVALLQAGAGCQKSDDTASKKKDGDVTEARLARLSASLANAKTADPGEPIARWLLPAELSEISGLALTPDGRLFTHNDEVARITEIDYKRGTVIKHFTVGQGVRGDFEGLACAGERFFLLSSDGTLYEFGEGKEGESVSYSTHNTGLGKNCEFEGAAYDAANNAIVLACKNAAKKQFKGKLVLYRYSLDDGGENSELQIPFEEAAGENGWKQLRPTDIAVDPATGNYVLVAAQEKALVVLTPDGKVVLSRPLEGRHPQPEGIAITQDHILIIADESNRTAATITLYRWPLSGDS